MHQPLKNPLSYWYETFNRSLIVRSLETVQDLIVISLCIGLFCVMVIQLRGIFFLMLPPINFHAVTADILFLLILVELFRLPIIYLQEQRVSTGVAVEVSYRLCAARSHCARSAGSPLESDPSCLRFPSRSCSTSSRSSLDTAHL